MGRGRSAVLPVPFAAGLRFPGHLKRKNHRALVAIEGISLNSSRVGRGRAPRWAPLQEDRHNHDTGGTVFLDLTGFAVRSQLVRRASQVP